MKNLFWDIPFPTNSTIGSPILQKELSVWPTLDLEQIDVNSSLPWQQHHISIKKHSVFGRVIEGIHFLREMKNVPVDKNDRPEHPIIIETITVLVNSAKDAEEFEKVRSEPRMKELQDRDALHRIKALGGITKQRNEIAKPPTSSIVNTYIEIKF